MLEFAETAVRTQRNTQPSGKDLQGGKPLSRQGINGTICDEADEHRDDRVNPARQASHGDIVRALQHIGDLADESVFPGNSDYHGRKITAQHVRSYLQSGFRRFTDVIETVQPLTRAGDSVLDVGIGYGFYSVVLKELLHLDVRGTDVPDNTGIYCNLCTHSGVQVTPFDLVNSKPPFEKESMHGVILSEVIEHLRLDPALAICKCAWFTKPGGWILVTTPNIAKFGNILRLMAGKNIVESFSPPEKMPDKSKGYKEEDTRSHVREYTKEEVCHLMVRSGLTVEWAKTRNLRGHIPASHSVSSKLAGLARSMAIYLPVYRDNIVVLARKGADWSPPLWARDWLADCSFC